MLVSRCTLSYEIPPCHHVSVQWPSSRPPGNLFLTSSSLHPVKTHRIPDFSNVPPAFRRQFAAGRCSDTCPASTSLSPCRNCLLCLCLCHLALPSFLRPFHPQVLFDLALHCLYHMRNAIYALFAKMKQKFDAAASLASLAVLCPKSWP